MDAMDDAGARASLEPGCSADSTIPIILAETQSTQSDTKLAV